MTYTTNLPEQDDGRCSSCVMLCEHAGICEFLDCEIKQPRTTNCNLYMPRLNEEPDGEGV